MRSMSWKLGLLTPCSMWRKESTEILSFSASCSPVNRRNCRAVWILLPMICIFVLIWSFPTYSVLYHSIEGYLKFKNGLYCTFVSNQYELYQEPPEFIQKLTRSFCHPPVMFSYMSGTYEMRMPIKHLTRVTLDPPARISYAARFAGCHSTPAALSDA